MKDFLKKNKIILAIAGYLTLIGLFFYFAVMPASEKITGKANDIQQEKIDQEITNMKIAAVPAIEKDYENYKENEGNLNFLIDQSQAQDVEFIKDLEGLAADTGNRIEFKIQDAVKVADKNKKKDDANIKDKLAYADFISMQIALEGNYHSLLDFLHKLENHKNYVNILSVRSEKILLNDANNQNSPAASPSGKAKSASKEVLNSILDVAVYTKK